MMRIPLLRDIVVGLVATSFLVSPPPALADDDSYVLCVKRVGKNKSVVKSLFFPDSFISDDRGCPLSYEVFSVGKALKSEIPNFADLLKGERGATGPVGPMGPVGPTGPQGQAGADGVAGNTGPTGQQGSPGLTGATGEPGPMGPIGLVGPVGPQGEQGPAGSTGPTGLQGIAGLQGIQGLVGVTGPMGPQGADGVCDALTCPDPLATLELRSGGNASRGSKTITAFVECSYGKIPLSGGAKITLPPGYTAADQDVRLIESAPTVTGWRATAVWREAPTVPASWSVAITLYCVEASGGGVIQ